MSDPGLFDEKQLPTAEQLAAVEAALAAVNRLVDLQFQLGYGVLQHAVHAQTELYRARHAVTHPE